MESISSDEKTCVDCKTSRTPLWRSGPAGPKSLCNACGIRFRKKRTVIGTEKKSPLPLLSPSRSPSPTSSSSSVTASNKIASRNIDDTDNDHDEMKRKKGEIIKKKLRIKLVALGKEVVLWQRQRSPMKKVKRRKMVMFGNEYRKFGEVEQAAVLLMSLSCGSVFG